MNAYWEAVKPYVVDGVIQPRQDLGGNNQAWADGMRMRYSWTVSDPETVEFVARHLDAYAVDPMAGNGWWGAVLLGQTYLMEFDRHPRSAHVSLADATWAAERASGALLFAWPPRYEDIGERTIRAYRGPRIVHMGAQGRTSDGTDEMRQLLADEWVEVARHTPVRWFGVKDFVTVYERK